MQQGETRLRNLRITGVAAANGGHFDKVRITGEAELRGDVDCNEFRLVGTAHDAGDLRSKRLRIIGEAAVDGKLSCDVIKVMGTLTVDGDCTAEVLEARGAISMRGLVNAGRMEIRLHGPSEAGDIGGGFIRVRPRRGWRANHQQLTCQTIEGDDIHLEYTRADVVRGKRIYIGPGCDIGSVEYGDTFRQSSRAVVREERRI